ncbi:hypothetical protein QL285_031241 [Trifolium repens]|nr:hypothetical protein QL285_031241 [Trifolium repens]
MQLGTDINEANDVVNEEIDVQQGTDVNVEICVQQGTGVYEEICVQQGTDVYEEIDVQQGTGVYEEICVQQGTGVYEEIDVEQGLEMSRLDSIIIGSARYSVRVRHELFFQLEFGLFRVHEQSGSAR